METRPNAVFEDVDPYRIHLQTAKESELQLLPGIGPKMALRIVEYRKTHELRTPDDLDGVYGIGQRKIEHLRWLVATEDEIK
jgi:competence protein ComEA